MGEVLAINLVGLAITGQVKMVSAVRQMAQDLEAQATALRADLLVVVQAAMVHREVVTAAAVIVVSSNEKAVLGCTMTGTQSVLVISFRRLCLTKLWVRSCHHIP